MSAWRQESGYVAPCPGFRTAHGSNPPTEPILSRRSRLGSRAAARIVAGAIRADAGFAVHFLSRGSRGDGGGPRHHAATGLRVQACGDCHLLNFGGFATPERNIMFDINDFDETLPAPWEWDIKRLVASSFSPRARRAERSDGHDVAVGAASSYRERCGIRTDVAAGGLVCARRCRGLPQPHNRSRSQEARAAEDR